VYPVERAEHLMFADVEGELHADTSTRWSGLLRGAVEQRAEGIAVDLRGCRGIDAHCVETLLATATTLKARGGSGVVLVVLPGSELADEVRLLAGDELRICDSVNAAMHALGARRFPVPPLVRLEQDGEIAIIAVNGEFDLAGAEDFQEVLDEAVALETRSLIVDLEHCEFIDSTGIGLLLSSFQLAKERAVGFGLVASGPQVHRALDLVGIPHYLPTFDARKHAIEALAS
jgi:anti-anti-sigma factor